MSAWVEGCDGTGVVVVDRVTAQTVAHVGEVSAENIERGKLFAASPDLAEAAEAFVAQHTEDGICGPDSSAKAEGADEWCGWCIAARSALRAAGRLP